MKFGMMFSDIFSSFFKKPATEKYPFERHEVPDRLRGKLYWDPSQCSGCGLCTKDCPSGAIELITLDRANKRFVMRYNAARCVFCAQCVANCRFKCLGMSNENWELAALKQEPFTVYYGDEENVDMLLEQLGSANAEGHGGVYE